MSITYMIWCWHTFETAYVNKVTLNRFGIQKDAKLLSSIRFGNMFIPIKQYAVKTKKQSQLSFVRK